MGAPPGRDRHIDLLRALAIVAVVLGHWLDIAIGYVPGRGIDGHGALEDLPAARPMTWLFQVMPLFFLVGGFANAVSLKGRSRRGESTAYWLLGRAARLLWPCTALLVVLAVGALAARGLGADPLTIATATWFAAIPLWFLMVYLAVVALAPLTYALHRRAGLAVPVLLLVLVGAGDIARLGFGAQALGAVNYLFGWTAVHQAGFCWQDGRLPARPAVGLPLAAVAGTVLVLLTVAGPYPISMVAVPGAGPENTSPPTLALMALAATQTGLALALRDRSDRWLRRSRAWRVVVGVNLVVLTLFLWHMTAAVVAAAALYPTGILPPSRVGSGTWLLLRVPWLLTLALILAVLVAGFGRVERRSRRPYGTGGPAPAGGGPPRARWPVALGAGAGLAAVLAGLLGITTAGRDYHGPAGLPTWTLLAYLGGVAVLWLTGRAARPRPRATRRDL